MYRSEGLFVGWRVRRHLGDAAVAAVAWYLASVVGGGELVREDGVVAVLAVGLQLLLFYFVGLYDSPEPRPRLQVASRLVAAVAGQGVVLGGLFFLSGYELERSYLLAYLLLDLALALPWRLLDQLAHRPSRRRVALLGGGTAARELEEKIARHHWHGLEVVGYVRTPDAPPAPLRAPVLGGLEDVPRLIAAGAFDDLVVVAPSHSWQSRLLDEVARGGRDTVSVFLLPGPFESLVGRLRYRWVSDIPLIDVVRPADWRLRRPLKRSVDLALGSLLLLLSLPLVIGGALAVLLSSPGPVLHRQTRIGYGQRPFTLLKLRTMRVGAEAGDQEVLAVPGDPRLTPLGALMRRLRLDELPQLLHVLAGTMSLVGPRPERPGFVRRYLEEVPGYAGRFALPPGLTGLAQVNGEYDSSAENKLRYDLAYLANCSLWLDLSILFRTVRIVLSTRGV